MIAQWRPKSPGPNPQAVKAAIDETVKAAIVKSGHPWLGTVEVCVEGRRYTARWAITEKPGLFGGRVLIMAPETVERVWEVRLTHP